MAWRAAIQKFLPSQFSPSSLDLYLVCDLCSEKDHGVGGVLRPLHHVECHDI